MKKIFASILFLLILFVLSVFIFNKESAYEYFPDDSLLVVRVNNYKNLLSLHIPFLEGKNEFKRITNSVFFKIMPAKAFYVVMDKNKHYYIYMELSFFSHFLKDYGMVKKNIFCYTDNEKYELKKRTFLKRNPYFKKYLNSKKDAFFYTVLPENSINRSIAGKVVWGNITAYKKDNIVKLTYNLDYMYKKVEFGKANLFLSKIPDRLDFFIKVNMKNFGVHYIDLRNLFLNTSIFKNYMDLKKKIFDKTGVDIENHLLPLINDRFFFGIKNRNDYFLVLSGVAKKRIDEILAKLEDQYPLKFKEQSYHKQDYKTVFITGFAGFLARGIFGKKIENIKKPYLLSDDNTLYIFDNYNFLKNYIDRDKTYSLLTDDVYKKFIKYLPSASHITVFFNDYMQNLVFKNKHYFENVKRTMFNMIFEKEKLYGVFLFELK